MKLFGKKVAVEKEEYFQQNGYVVFEADETQRQLAVAAKDSFYKFKENNLQNINRICDDSGTVSRIINLHAYSDALFRCFASCSEVMDFCDKFLGRSVAYTSLYFERGSNQELHRDTPYFVTNPLYKFLGVWLALDNVGPANGPLVVVPGSHKLPEEDLQNIKEQVHGSNAVDPYSSALWDEYQSRVNARCLNAGLVAREIHVNIGDVIIWHPQLVHGGAKTLDDRQTRNSIVFHVIPRNSRVGHQDAFYGDSRLPVVGATRQHYVSRFGREYLAIDRVGFSHSFDVDLMKLK